MTPADRLETRLRAELRRADGLPVDDRYDAVLARSAQRTRRGRTLVAAGALAVAGVLATGVGAVVGQDRGTTPPVVHEPPAQLSGTWTRLVDGEPWRITFAPGAELLVVAPSGVEGTDGASYRATATSLRLDALSNGACFDSAPGSYQWSVHPTGELVLRAETEPCEARRSAFDGTWTQAP
jgi:hypothetical protein